MFVTKDVFITSYSFDLQRYTYIHNEFPLVDTPWRLNPIGLHLTLDSLNVSSVLPVDVNLHHKDILYVFHNLTDVYLILFFLSSVRTPPFLKIYYYIFILKNLSNCYIYN